MVSATEIACRRRDGNQVYRIAAMNETREEKFGDSPNSPENEYDEMEEFVDNDEMEEFGDNNGRDDGEVLPEIRSTEEILRQVQRELALIKLCWSDIPIPKDLYAQSLPDTYRCVNEKEKLLLWYAENFRRQIHAKDASRRPLLLARENECGVQVGTYILKINVDLAKVVTAI